MYEPVLPPNVPMPLDQELLAWAAGFFDGEGSTIARAYSRRPDYFQLEVSVPQSGPSGEPEVLRKFQMSMLGVGKIYPQHRDAMYKWSACGRIGSELTLALMWPWLGEVKRAQAATAAAIVASSYESGRFRRGRARQTPTFVPHSARETGSSEESRCELSWAAGFLDGEGYFGLPKEYERSDASTGYVVRASATQHSADTSPPAVLLRLQKALGIGRIECHGKEDDFKWVTEGPFSVRLVLESTRTWLGSVKTMQAETALAFASAHRIRGDAERCVRGHLYDRIDISPDGRIHRRCNTCERINNRERRAALGAKPRRLKNPSPDPSRIYAA